MKLCWLVPDDRSGGVASVAEACCQQLGKSGYDVTLLLVLYPTGRISPSQLFRLDSLHLVGEAKNTPKALLEWLKANPQNFLFLNGCEQADLVIPYLPANIYCIYIVHDTASRYWKVALQQELNINKIIAVSNIVAHRFRHQLRYPERLTVIHNGIEFPELLKKDVSYSDSILF